MHTTVGVTWAIIAAKVPTRIRIDKRGFLWMGHCLPRKPDDLGPQRNTRPAACVEMASRSYWFKLKENWSCDLRSRGCESGHVGIRHGATRYSLAAAIAAGTNTGSPDQACTSLTSPLLVIVNSTVTTPWMRASFATFGYTGRALWMAPQFSVEARKSPTWILVGTSTDGFGSGRDLRSQATSSSSGVTQSALCTSPF
jgi:hypothetical protein